MESLNVSVVTRVVNVVHRTSGEGGVSVADLIRRLRRAGLGPRLRKTKKLRKGGVGVEVDHARATAVAEVVSAAPNVDPLFKGDGDGRTTIHDIYNGSGDVSGDGNGDGNGDGKGDGTSLDAKLPPWNVMVASVLWVVGLVGMLATMGTHTHNISDGHNELFNNHKWLAPDSIAFNTALLLSIILASPNIVARAFGSLVYGLFDINLLMTLAMIGACILQDFLEGATIVVIFSWSAYIEMRASARATAAIEEILDLSPPTASVILENRNDDGNGARNNTNTNANTDTKDLAMLRRVEVDVEDVTVGSLVAVYVSSFKHTA